MENRPGCPRSETNGTEDYDAGDAHILITHLGSLAGYEVDSVIEVKYPGKGEREHYKEAVNEIVRILENAFMNIAFAEPEKSKGLCSRKKSSILMDIRIRYHE